MQPDSSRVVATGTWLYDGSVPCKVIIQREDVWPAFYDPEDDPNVDDKVMPCVSVWFENAGGGYTTDAGGGYYHTVDEAKTAVEMTLPSKVVWET